MELLKEIHVKDGLRLNGKAVFRDAVRAIIRNGRDVLMIYSTKNGDYKFPGGGMNTGEEQADALRREIAEECGIDSLDIIAPYGMVIEYDSPKEPGFDVFKMTSYYYLCRSGSQFGKLSLDAYEKDLGFTPQWVDIVKATVNNRTLLRERPQSLPRWVTRDTFILERLRDEQ